MRGRAFTEHDRAGTQPVAIVNETFVQRFFEDVDPLTQRIVVEQLIPGATRLGPPIEWQIVGVYRDIRNAGPRNDGFPEIDVPFPQSPGPASRVAVRTAGDPPAPQARLAAVVRGDRSRSADGRRADHGSARPTSSIAADRFRTVSSAASAPSRLLLAALGIYGVMSFVVSRSARRKSACAWRSAPSARSVVGQVLREGMAAAGTGVALGFGRRLLRRPRDAGHVVRCWRHRSDRVQRGRSGS